MKQIICWCQKLFGSCGLLCWANGFSWGKSFDMMLVPTQMDPSLLFILIFRWWLLLNGQLSTFLPRIPAKLALYSCPLTSTNHLPWVVNDSWQLKHPNWLTKSCAGSFPNIPHPSIASGICSTLAWSNSWLQPYPSFSRQTHRGSRFAGHFCWTLTSHPPTSLHQVK